MSKQAGDYAEALFIAECLKNGFHVSTTWGDRYPYDVIAGHPEGILQKVQVKSTSTFSGTRNGGSYVSCIKHSAGKGKVKQYNPVEVDLIALFVEPEYVWYIIPTYAIQGTTCRFYPHRVNDEGFYEVYKDDWSTLNRKKV